MPIRSPYKSTLLTGIILIFLSGCGEHFGKDIKNFTGEYRYQSGIGQFFDCASAKSYYVFHSTAHTTLKQAYIALNLKHSDDVYVHVKGYLELIEQLEGVDPTTEFVPTKLISMDIDRGCKQSPRQGQ